MGERVVATSSDFWPDYYDKGYERELELLDDVLKEAGGNAYRALKLYSDKLGRYDRMFEIGERDGQAVIDHRIAGVHRGLDSRRNHPDVVLSGPELPDPLVPGRLHYGARRHRGGG